MLDFDDTDLGMIVLGVIAMVGIAAAALSSVVGFGDIKEIVLVCVAGVSGCIGMNKRR